MIKSKDIKITLWDKVEEEQIIYKGFADLISSPGQSVGESADCGDESFDESFEIREIEINGKIFKGDE